MKIRHQKNTKKIIVAVIIVLIIAIAVACGFLCLKNDQSKEAESSKEATSQTTNTSDDSKKDNDEDTQDDNNSDEEESESTTANNDPTNGGKTPPRYEGGYAQNRENLTGAITGINLVNDSLSIRVTIDQYIDDPNGRCDLKLTDPSGKTYTFWSDLIANPQTSTCYGWDITADDLSGNIASGHWKAEVTASGDNRTGTFTKEVDL